MPGVEHGLTPDDSCADCGASFTSKDWRQWRRDDVGDPYCGICSRSRGLRD